MNGVKHEGSRLINDGVPAGGEWSFVDTVDNVDPAPSITWQHTEGALRFWRMNVAGRHPYRFELYDLGFSVQPPGQDWKCKGYAPIHRIPWQHAPVFQNKAGQVAYRDYTVDKIKYLNGGKPVSPEWTLLGCYPRSK